MKTFSYSLTASIKKIKKAHKRTKAVSWIYAIGFIVLTVLAFFPTVNIQFAGKGKLFIGTFFWPLIHIFKKNLNVVDLVVMALYLAMIVFMLIYFFKGITRFGKILRRTSGNVTTCNKNLAIMEEIADAFAGSLASFVIFNFIIYMITYATKSTSPLFGAITLWAMIALVVGLIVHFWAGALGANVSVFIIGSTIEERKREDKVFPFFMRNLVQVIAIAAILYFFAPATNLYIELGNLFTKGETSALTDFSNLFAFLAVVLQVVVMVTSIVLIKHATAMTEFNRIGMDGIGMRNFRVFGILTTLLCVGLFVVDESFVHMNYLYAALVGLVATVLDFIIKPKVAKKPPEDDPMLRKYKEAALQEDNKPEQEQQQAMPQMQNCCLYARPCYPSGVIPQQQTAEPKPDTTTNSETGDSITNNTQYSVVNGGAVVNNENNGVVDGLPEGLPPQIPTIIEVKCPFCEKLLAVKDSAPYHRCPTCGKVFQIRKGQKVSGKYDASTQTENNNA